MSDSDEIITIDLPEFGMPEIKWVESDDPDKVSFKVTQKPTGRIVRVSMPKSELEQILLKHDVATAVEAYLKEVEQAAEFVAKTVSEGFNEPTPRKLSTE